MMRKGHAGDASGRYSWDGLNNTNGKVFLSLMEQFIFAMALTEIEVMQTSEDNMVEISAVRMKMNDILKLLVKGGNK